MISVIVRVDLCDFSHGQGGSVISVMPRVGLCDFSHGQGGSL